MVLDNTLKRIYTWQGSLKFKEITDLTCTNLSNEIRKLRKICDLTLYQIDTKSPIPIQGSIIIIINNVLSISQYSYT